MKRFIHIEDNEDGTCTMSMRVLENEPEMTVLFPISFDDLYEAVMGGPAMPADTIVQLAESVVIIPNEL